MLSLRCELFGRNCQVTTGHGYEVQEMVCRAVTPAQHSRVSHSYHGAEALVQHHLTPGDVREK